MCMPPGHQHHSRYSGPLPVGIWNSWWGGSSSPCHEDVLAQPTLQQSPFKVDFENAFNSVRRDKMLRAVTRFIPELLYYVHSAYSAESVLLWGKVETTSAEGIQQGYPVDPLLLCLSIHDLVSIVWSWNTKSFISMMVQLEAHLKTSLQTWHTLKKRESN